MITIKRELVDAIRKSGHTQRTIAPLIGLSGATSLRKNGHVSWELDKCLHLMDILKIPRENLFEYWREDL